MEVCGAKTRDGGKCGNKAGKGTDHLGEGKCHLHGGRSGTLKHGFYSQYGNRRLSDRISEIREADGELTSLEDEIALARAAIAELIDDRQALDTETIESLVGLLDKASRIVQRHSKIKFGTKFTIEAGEVEQFITVVKQTINQKFETCESPAELQDAIGEKLSAETDTAGEVI